MAACAFHANQSWQPKVPARISRAVFLRQANRDLSSHPFSPFHRSTDHFLGHNGACFKKLAVPGNCFPFQFTRANGTFAKRSMDRSSVERLDTVVLNSTLFSSNIRFLVFIKTRNLYFFLFFFMFFDVREPWINEILLWMSFNVIWGSE